MRPKRNERRPNPNDERGMTLFFVAAALVVVLGMAALSIDLVSLYAARSEAQRAADAAALAGAKEFVDSGFTTGAVTQAVVQTLATNEAITVGNQNRMGGQSPAIAASDVSFDFSIAGDPRITVVVQRTAARGNAMPTFFAKIFGVSTADVSAQATAEAYNPSGSSSGPAFCASCLKPLLMPNCDSVHLTPANPNCAGAGYFFDPNNNYSIVHPGLYSSGGVVGETWTLHSDAGPSQWYAIALGGAQSKSAWQQDLAVCYTGGLACGDTLQTLNGKAVGPSAQGIDPLIHATNPGVCDYPSTCPQDTIDTSTGPPFPIIGGTNNPNPALVGKTITSSDSIVAVPVYDGHALSPGGDTVTVVGYMQIFIKYIVHNGKNDDITSVILNISGCGAVGGGCSSNGSGSLSGGGASLVPVRLVKSN